MSLTKGQANLLEDAKTFFVGHTEAVGVLIPEGQPRMFLKSGEEGGPWGGTQRGVFQEAYQSTNWSIGLRFLGRGIQSRQHSNSC